VRSESEVRLVRSKNIVGQILKASNWHAIIPGVGDLNLPPGTACSTGLVGTLQFAAWSGWKNLDGRIHPECRALVEAWLETIDPSPGPGTPPDSEEQLAPPKTTYTESPRAEPKSK